MATFWQGTGRDWSVIAACHARGCDRPSQRPGRLQCCGYTEHNSTLEGGVVTSLVGEYWPSWLLSACIFRKLTVYYWYTYSKTEIFRRPRKSVSCPLVQYCNVCCGTHRSPPTRTYTIPLKSRGAFKATTSLLQVTSTYTTLSCNMHISAALWT